MGYVQVLDIYVLPRGRGLITAHAPFESFSEYKASTRPQDKPLLYLKGLSLLSVHSEKQITVWAYLNML